MAPYFAHVRVEQPDFAETSFGRAVITVTRALQAGAQAARSAYQMVRAAPTATTADLADRAAAIGRDMLRAGLSIRSTGVAPEFNLGLYKPFTASHPTKAATAAALLSKEARYARTTAGAGFTPLSMASMPEITLDEIALAQRRCHRTGWADRHQDIIMRQRRDDSHVGAVDLKTRAWVYKTPLRIRARSASVLSGLVASAVRASLDQVDGFASSVGDLQVVGGAGYACAELVWRECALSIPVGRGHSVRVPSEIVGSLAELYPRNAAFDIIDDSPWLVYGPDDFQPIARPEQQKWLWMQGPQPGPTRFRGWGWANSWLSFFAGVGLEKFHHLMHLFGIVTPYLQRKSAGHLAPDEHDHALAILSRLGSGTGEVIPEHYGEIKHNPIPASLTPMHQAFLGWVRTEQSKLISLQTLSIEIGAVGSQAAATVHADGLVDTQRIYATLTAEALRTQLVRYLLQANRVRWALAFSPLVPGGCTPDDIEAELPIVEWVLADDTATQRLAIFQGVKGLGYDLDEEQVRAELRMLAPTAPAEPEEPAPEPAPELALTTPTPDAAAPAETLP